MMIRVLIIGGAGTFGKRIAERLAKTENVSLILAGRTPCKLLDAAEKLQQDSGQVIETAVLDGAKLTAENLSALRTDIIINAAGPFQSDSYSVARAAIAARCHYIDLADARDFVCGIDSLDEDARKAGVAVISGASSVPGISSVVVEHFAKKLEHINTVSIGISPGNHFDPGLATTRSVLKGIGQPIVHRHNGRDQIGYGWQSLGREPIGALGKRWMANVDVPDLDLIPRHHPDIESVRFQAGTELFVQHFGIWLLSWFARTRLMKHPDKLAPILLGMRRLTSSFGSNRGGMFVHASGRDTTGQRQSYRWSLVADQGHGPYVPTLASTILTKSVARGAPILTGARACYNLFTLADLEQETRDLAITCTLQDVVP